MIDLSTFTYDLVKQHEGSQFRLDFDSGETVMLTLTRVDKLMDKNAHPRMTRDTFALIFTGPLDQFLQQNTYAMQHEVLGAPIVLFIVPVAKNDDGFQYEAVFN